MLMSTLSGAMVNMSMWYDDGDCHCRNLLGVSDGEAAVVSMADELVICL